MEKNIFGNDRFQNGLVRFGLHVLRIAIPDTQPMPLGFNNPDDPNLIIIPASYRTVLHFQGFMNVLDIVDGAVFGEFTFKLNVANGDAENSILGRPGTAGEYSRLQIFSSGYAYYRGGTVPIPPIRPGQNLRTTFMGEGGPFRGPQGETYPGLGSAAYLRTAATAIGRGGIAFQTPLAGRRAYQLLLQESEAPLSCTAPATRWRVLIQTYRLWVNPWRDKPEIRRNHLSISPTGIIKEIPF